eukprot:gene11801-2181_t
MDPVESFLIESIQKKAKPNDDDPGDLFAISRSSSINLGDLGEGNGATVEAATSPAPSAQSFSEEATMTGDTDEDVEEDAESTRSSHLSLENIEEPPDSRNQKVTSNRKGNKQQIIKKVLKRPWSNEHKAPDPYLEQCKVMHSFQKSLNESTATKEKEPTMNADTHYCLSLAERMSNLDSRSKVYVRHQIENIFFDLEFGGLQQSMEFPTSHAGLTRPASARTTAAYPVEQSRDFLSFLEG